SGVGRIGAIVGPTAGGTLLAAELPIHQTFLVFAVPAALSALTMVVFMITHKRRTEAVQLSAA
ncbi:aromatic acid/H+ symport family MFS transporter, partial [Acinetobacter baumannii]